MKKNFGIIGKPIKHSLSPVLHNYWFEKYEIEANYSLIDTNENELSSIVDKVRDKTYSGINITLPYKQKIVPYLDLLVNDAETTSSVNTIFLNDENSFAFLDNDFIKISTAGIVSLRFIKIATCIAVGYVSLLDCDMLT